MSIHSESGSKSSESQLQYRNKYEFEGSCCFKTRPDWRIMPDRTIISNCRDTELPSNVIRTCKYTSWSFLPLNLIEQFSKMANIYFLIIGYLETVEAVSITEGKPVIWFPLFVVVAISAFKDFLEDRKRQVSDDEENMRKVLVLKQHGFQEVEWKDLYVGDIIRIEQGEFFPADVVLLKTSEKGACFIETKNLDGETNLKVKKIHKCLKYLKEIDSDCKFYDEKLLLKYEKPNPYLYQFQGNLTLPHNRQLSEGESRSSLINYDKHNRQIIQLEESNFILRGCSLRNTHFIYGIVVYTGFDTKIMLNSTKSRPKQSHLEQQMNFFIILVFFIQLVVCLFSAQYSAFWQLDNYMDTPYLEIDREELQNNIIISTLEKWGTWLLIFTNFVPISLLVTLEMVKYLQGIFIHQDKYCQTRDHPAEVQTSNLNEELGQVDYMFTDKTGTITKNLMEFKTISILGRSYGDSENNLSIEQLQSLPEVTNVDFRDANLFKDLQDRELNDGMSNFFMHLAICHTILVEYENMKIRYNSSSPDELALVMGAKYCGFEFIGAEDNFIKVKNEDRIFKFKLLNVLEFTSQRKRMSVIIQLEDNSIKLLTKGADSIIIKLLAQSNQNTQLVLQTEKHLESYASRGLRTLLLAEKQIPLSQYENWIQRYQMAHLQINNRDQLISELQNEIENDLDLLGGTGIEDKLQDDVAIVMQRIQQADIKIWVLTGDKLETAINISYSCNLLNDSQLKIIIHADSEQEVSLKINHGLEQIKNAYGSRASLIISGDSLIYLNENLQSKLIQIAKQCQTVIACRVSPKQKQELVQMVTDYVPNITTLAVGDGANDVNMITAANIGIGIKGVEGNQAARSADYSIGEFKVLQQLLLHHGRECYRRNQVVVGYNFYKNLLIVFPHFWYSFYNGFSPLNLYDPWLYQFYNMFYTSMPIVIYAVLDEQYSKSFLLQHPELYRTTNKFTLLSCLFWFTAGLVQSAVVIYSVFPSMEQTSIDRNGRILFLSSVGMAVFCYAIIVANLKLLIFSFSNTFVSISILLCSIATYLISYMVLSQFTNTLDISHTFLHLITNIQFYFVLLSIIILTTMTDLSVWRWQLFSDQTLFQMKYLISPQEEVTSQQSRNGSCIRSLPPERFDNLFETLEQQEQDEDEPFLPTRPIQTRKYTGYAFAQQEKYLDEALRTAQN